MGKTDAKDGDYANRIIKKYEETIWEKIHKKMPAYTEDGAPDIQEADRDDVFNDVVCTFLEIVDKGKFKGKHGEPSAVACLCSITENKCNDFFRRRKIEKKYTDHEPNSDDNERDPWIESFSYDEPAVDFDPEKRCEITEEDEIISKEARQLDVMELRREGYEIKEIASALGLPYEQVKKRLQRERENLSRPLGLGKNKKTLK